MQEEVDHNRRLLLPSAYFAFIHDKNGDKFITFCSINGEVVATKRVPRQLQINDFKIDCGNWLMSWDEDENTCRHFLWDVRIMEDNPIHFPDFELKAGHIINEHLLTAPPGDPDCMVVLLEKTRDGPSLSYCREGDECWTHYVITDRRLDADPDWFLWTPVMCNGKLYCCGMGCGGNVVVVAIDIKPDGLVLDLVLDVLGALEPSSLKGSWESDEYRFESCGELFNINLSFHTKNEEQEVCAVEVFKLHSGEQWRRLENFEDIAFFISPFSQFSYPATSSIKGNHVYFTLLDESSNYYAFNMEDQTIMFCTMPRPSPMSTLLASFWVNPGLRSSNLVQNEKHVGKFEFDDAKEDTKSKNEEIATIEGAFGKLPFELQVEIGRLLPLHDYMNFRFVNSMFKEVASLTRWKKPNLEKFQGNIYSPPLLMSCQTRNNIWNLIDPFHKERYFMTHNGALEHPAICYSKRGWCLLIYKSSMLLWNPFTKKTIPLRDLPFSTMFVGCSFFSLSDSPESDCTVVVGIENGDRCLFIKLGGKNWASYFFKYTSMFNKLMTTDNCLLLCKETFYFLDEKGNLGVYKNRDNDDVIDENGDVFKVLNYVIKCPYESFYQSALLECDNKILSVFLDFGGKNVQVFKLDEANMAWSNVESIGNHTIYLSRFSSFSTLASPGMHDRIYFSRYSGKRNLIYYSLESRMLHSHGTEEVLKDFNTVTTEEQILCGWVTPTF